MRTLVLLIVTVLAGCGPTMVVLKNPATGEVQQCKGDALANWEAA